jgi:hypothetical protein
MTKEDLAEVSRNCIGPDASFATVTPGQITMRADGQIILVGGINWYWEGVGESWCILHARSQKCRFTKCRFTTYKALKKMHTILLNRSKPFHRIQATVRTNWPEAIKMVEKLGYKREGLLKKYCPDGADVYMYAVTT